MKLPSKKVVLNTFSILIAIAVLLSVVPAVYAAGTDPLAPIPGLGRLNNSALIRMHQSEATWYTDQETLLKKADTLAATFQTLIDAEAKQNKNVSILQTGLATFESEVAKCREIHLVAGASVFSTVGFKVNGDVRERFAAGQSLISGRASLKEAHIRLTIAMDDLQRSYASWRHSRIPGQN